MERARKRPEKSSQGNMLAGEREKPYNEENTMAAAWQQYP